MNISINNITETISNPAGRFSTLCNIVPQLDGNGEVVVSCDHGRFEFAIFWNNRPYTLGYFCNKAAYSPRSLMEVSEYLTRHPQK